MKRLPLILCVPALALIGACSNEPDDGTAGIEAQNEAMTAEGGTMMLPAETRTTNGNGTMGTDLPMGINGAGATTGTMDEMTGGPLGGTIGSGPVGTSSAGTTGTGAGRSTGQTMPPG